MTIRNVPGSFASVQDAMAAAVAGDTIKIASGHVVSGPVVVIRENLRFDAPADVSFIATPATGIKKITLLGEGGIQLFGDISNNTFTGNAGANFLIDGGGDGLPNSGNDILNGGGGDDRLRFTNGTDTANGGAGEDILDIDYFAQTAPVTMSHGPVVGSGKVSAGANVVTFTGIERFEIISGSGNDFLVGGAGTDTIEGMDGNDTFLDSGGNDGLRGGNGNDVFHVLGNASVVDGGAGSDRAIGSNLGGTIFADVEVLDTKGTVRGTTEQLSAFTTIKDSVGAANSQILIKLHGAGRQFGIGGTLDLSTRINGEHSVNLVDDGLTGGVIITGSKNSDRLQGSAFQDTLNGGEGNDRLDGGTATDGGAVADIMAGGTGNDTYVVNEAADQVSEAVNQGTDTVETTLSSYTLGSDVENLTFTGAGSFNGTGNSLANKIFGGSGSDSLKGGIGQDALDGKTGTDQADYSDKTAAVVVTLAGTANANVKVGGVVEDTIRNFENVQGGSGNDTLGGDGLANELRGMDGNDVLQGGGGKDVLTGGLGNDKFDFDTALSVLTNVDTIIDFNVADDTIRLENSIFTALTATGILSAAAFHIGAGAAAADDRIIYNNATGDLFYDSNGNAVGGQVQFADLSAGLSLTFKDFVVI